MKKYSLKNGIVAGFAATVVLSALMLLKGAMGMMPKMNVIHMLANMGHAYLGLPVNPAIGWVMHFFIGAIMWGVLFAMLSTRIKGAYCAYPLNLLLQRH